jgi:GNAT superfamily N-acetyltransferase
MHFPLTTVWYATHGMVRSTFHQGEQPEEAILAATRMTMTDDPARSDRDFLDERIYEYNVAATNIHDGRMMHFAVRDVRDEMVAGLSGWTWGSCAAVEFLWVRDDWRGKGLGTQLLASAEGEALARGCTHIVLSTHSFQAPEFYKKRGYEAYSAVDDYPRGFSLLHLKKKLRRTLAPD